MDHGHHPKTQNQYGGVNIETGGGSDRFPHWSIQETRDLLMIRAELDSAFMETKRNKLIWDTVSTRMREMGYNRSPDQCKFKWKNLVTRYKGYETMESEVMKQQFPFYNEMQTIFTARMQRMMWLAAEGGAASTKKAAAQFSSGDEDDHNDDHTQLGQEGRAKKKRKMEEGENNNNNSNNRSIGNGLREIMDDYMRQQMEMEMQWMRAYEERETRRREKEMEWRQRMEALERERERIERRWRQKEGERRIKEEARVEKREALISALVNKLRREGM